MTALLKLQESAFAHYLPWWWIGDDALVLVDGAVAVGFRVTGVDVTCEPDEAVNSIGHQLRSLLNAVPGGYQLQFLRRASAVDWSSFDAYLEALDSKDAILREQRRRSAEHLARSNLRRFEGYLLVSLPHALGKLGSHQRSKLVALAERVFGQKDPYSVTRAEHDAAIENLAHACDTITHLLTATGATVERLADRDLLTLCYSFLNPGSVAVPVLAEDRPGGDKAAPVSQRFSLREQLVHSSFSWDVDLCYLGDPLRLHRVMGLKALPPRTMVSLIQGISRLRFDHWLSIGLAIPDSERKFGELERRRNRAKAAAAGFARNIRADVQASELDEVMMAMVARDQRIFNMSLHLLFGADSLAQLDRRTREASEVFREMSGTVVQTEQYAQLPSLLGMLPGNAHRATHRRACLTDNAADFVPIYASAPGDDRPTFLAQTRAGEPYRIDITDPRRTNWNSTVFGQSGGGKTFLVLSLATSSMLGQGAPLIVIDVGGREMGSYYRLVQMLGGDFVDLSLDGANAVNPFFSRADLFTTDDGRPAAGPNELKLSFLTGITEMLLSEPSAPRITTVQQGVIQKAIVNAYDRLQDERPPVFSDVVAELELLKLDSEDNRVARGFAKTLRAWIEGPYGKLINQQSRVTIRSPFVVFDMKGIENVGRLAPAIIMIVSAYVWNMIARPRNTLAWVVYDECWKLLMNDTAAALQSELYRTARKLRAGVISVTQKLEDFLAAPASRAILSNTTTTFLLKHKDGHEAVGDLLGLNERELSLFRSLRTQKGEYAEAFYKSENGSAVLRVSPSPFEYWVNTTDPSDRALEAKVLAQVGNDRLLALRRLAREYPRGAVAQS